MAVGPEKLTRLRTIAALPRSGKEISQFALVTAACFAAGQLGLKITVLHPPVSPIWPPIGVALAVVLLLGYRLWPGVFLASFLICVSTSTPLPAAFTISLGNTLEVVSAAWLVNRFAPSKRRRIRRTLIPFLLYLVLWGISATFAAGHALDWAERVHAVAEVFEIYAVINLAGLAVFDLAVPAMRLDVTVIVLDHDRRVA